MNDDTISRPAAIDAFVKRTGIEWEKLKILEPMLCVLENLPSAQTETKKGEWIKENVVLTTDPPQYRWHCSECGKSVYGFSSGILTPYCPNCGAYMVNEGQPIKYLSKPIKR